MGMLTAGGYLVTERGLDRQAHAKALDDASPPLRPFVRPLRLLEELPERSESALTPAPTNRPNRDINQRTNLPFEGRSERHQSRNLFPAEKFFITRMGANPNASVHPDLP